ncbi:MAG: OsmC family peroxiredoxin [Gemmatimonadales bacterium]|nr:MAG: OsmC family peroxiredoxin [Gemmatimonadales bacterium]
MANNPRTASLRWSGEGMVFEGRVASEALTMIDGDSAAGPSPMELLLMSLAGCMAIDIRMILEKSRVDVKELAVRIEGMRADEEPKRFTRIEMVFELTGPTPDDDHRVARAIQLSRDKYCSVHHTLRPDLEVTTSYSLT